MTVSMPSSALNPASTLAWTTPDPRPAAPARFGQPRAHAHPADAPDSGDAAVLRRVQDGDEDAARLLVERLHPTVMKVVRSHLPRRLTCEDLSQAVYGKVFSRLHQFSGLVPLEHWVSRIAINTCLTQLKHETLRPELRMSDLGEAQAAVVEHLASTSEEIPDDSAVEAREVLERVMRQLKPEDRLVITLVHLEERSVAEVSRLTGWSCARVKVKAFRARWRLRKLVDALCADDSWRLAVSRPSSDVRSHSA